MKRLKLLFLKHQNGPFKGAERQQKRDGPFQSIQSPVRVGEAPHFVLHDLTFHCQNSAPLSEKRVTQCEKGRKMGEGS
jgi:hypothetical protein